MNTQVIGSGKNLTETADKKQGLEISKITDKKAEELPTITAQKKEVLARPMPTIEARLKKLDELNELVEKRDNVLSALDNVKKFYVSPTGQGCNLKLTDSTGNSFGIAHPAVIGEIVAMATDKLQQELNKIETALSFDF